MPTRGMRDTRSVEKPYQAIFALLDLPLPRQQPLLGAIGVARAEPDPRWKMLWHAPVLIPVRLVLAGETGLADILKGGVPIFHVIRW